MLTFNTLMVIGFLGIIWLMIYGNLSGNLGFQQSSLAFQNETINLSDAGNTPASALNRIDASLSNVTITNATRGEVVDAGNYTITGLIINASGPIVRTYNNSNVHVEYIVTFDSDADRSAEGVIRNLTEGANTFFGFSNVLFTITAIVLLITILMALLFLVLEIARAVKERGSKSSFSG